MAGPRSSPCHSISVPAHRTSLVSTLPAPTSNRRPGPEKLHTLRRSAESDVENDWRQGADRAVEGIEDSAAWEVNTCRSVAMVALRVRTSMVSRASLRSAWICKDRRRAQLEGQLSSTDEKGLEESHEPRPRLSSCSELRACPKCGRSCRPNSCTEPLPSPSISSSRPAPS